MLIHYLLIVQHLKCQHRPRAYSLLLDLSENMKSTWRNFLSSIASDTTTEFTVIRNFKITFRSKVFVQIVLSAEESLLSYIQSPGLENELLKM